MINIGEYYEETIISDKSESAEVYYMLKSTIKNNKFDEDKFLLDYVDYMQNKISMYDFAHKNNLTIMQAFNKLEEYKLIGGP